MSLLLRPETPADEEAVSAVVTAAFTAAGAETGPEAAFVRELRRDPGAHMARYSLVAMDGVIVVGHVLASRIRVGQGPALALAPLSVLPSRQRSGVGTQLVERVLSEAATAGETLVLVLGDPAFYGRFGFETASEVGIMGPYRGPSFMARRLAADAPVGEAVYSPVFQRLEAGLL
ncbi:GNAT family N-acetyltransferase [Pseudokineococcus sp. 1T1Z-3]|uniref:GNAT family N-acetyltransferase n=1 Tax=Pseudokineococcus sp. 1T1Z-3 TaxID=3132745 RepID=UPI0030B018D2